MTQNMMNKSPNMGRASVISYPVWAYVCVCVHVSVSEYVTAYMKV